MMNQIERGNEIFLAQLKEMAEGYKTMEECLLDNGIPVLQAEAFKVPGELREAFYAYHAEFLTDHGTCTNTSGPFYNDEDINEGVRKKYWYFYWPVVQKLNNQYPDLKFKVNIEPHYEDSSTILVMADNKYGKNRLAFPVVVLLEYVKAWHFPFDRPEEPNHIYAYLCSLYNRIDQVCLAALSIFDSTNITEGNILISKMLKDLAETAVGNMGDVFYNPDEFGDYRYGLDEGEEPRDGDSANQRLARNVTRCVYKALIKAYWLGMWNKQNHRAN